MFSEVLNKLDNIANTWDVKDAVTCSCLTEKCNVTFTYYISKIYKNTQQTKLVSIAKTTFNVASQLILYFSLYRCGRLTVSKATPAVSMAKKSVVGTKTSVPNVITWQ